MNGPQELHTPLAGQSVELPLQAPTRRPASRRSFDSHFLVEDRRALRDTDLADDEPVLVCDNAYLSVMTPAERADDVAEVVRILHFAEGKHPKTSTHGLRPSCPTTFRSFDDLPDAGNHEQAANEDGYGRQAHEEKDVSVAETEVAITCAALNFVPADASPDDQRPTDAEHEPASQYAPELHRLSHAGSIVCCGQGSLKAGRPDRGRELATRGAFAGLLDGDEPERAFLGGQERSEIVGFGLHGGGVRPTVVLRDREDAIPRTVVPDGVTLVERLRRIDELATPIGEVDDDGASAHLVLSFCLQPVLRLGDAAGPECSVPLERNSSRVLVGRSVCTRGSQVTSAPKASSWTLETIQRAPW